MDLKLQGKRALVTGSTRGSTVVVLDSWRIARRLEAEWGCQGRIVSGVDSRVA